jgi:hypothetical protein
LEQVEIIANKVNAPCAVELLFQFDEENRKKFLALAEIWDLAVFG